MYIKNRVFSAKSKVLCVLQNPPNFDLAFKMNKIKQNIKIWLSARL